MVGFRVLHVNKYDTIGGASRGVFWLHKTMRRIGMDSKMFVQIKKSNDVSIIAGSLPDFYYETIQSKFDKALCGPYPTSNLHSWSNNLLPNLSYRTINNLKPDIVNLHWVGSGFLPISHLRKLNGQLVWTLRDMWAFTGGCHYSDGCDKFKDVCTNCPKLKDKTILDISTHNFLSKKKHWENLDIYFVPISHWVKEQLLSSGIFRDPQYKVIPNGIDTNYFDGETQETRDTYHILFGATNIDDPRKGFSYFYKAIRLLGKDIDESAIKVTIFGSTTKNIKKYFNVEVNYRGFISDDTELRDLYLDADIMVIPSLQEAFGKTVIEAMACKTAVVAFNTGGPRDIIDHKIDGYLAKPGSAKDIADGLYWLLRDDIQLEKIKAACREKAVSKYDLKVIAEEYKNYYETILK